VGGLSAKGKRGGVLKKGRNDSLLMNQRVGKADKPLHGIRQWKMVSAWGERNLRGKKDEATFTIPGVGKGRKRLDRRKEKEKNAAGFAMGKKRSRGDLSFPTKRRKSCTSSALGGGVDEREGGGERTAYLRPNKGEARTRGFTLQMTNLKRGQSSGDKSEKEGVRGRRAVGKGKNTLSHLFS